MVKIAICDDEPMVLKRIRRLIMEPTAEIQTFCSGKEFVKSAEQFDIVMLDIEIPDMDGMKIAAELMKRNPDCILLFVTSFGHYSMKGYEFRAFRYILKTEPDSFIQRNIQDAIDEYNARNLFLEVTYKKEIAKIRALEIIYIESFKHIINVHTLHGVYQWSTTLEAIGKALQDYHFVQCHKSFFVNLKYIHSIERGEKVHLTIGPDIPIGRTYNTELIHKYLEYSDRRN